MQVSLKIKLKKCAKGHIKCFLTLKETTPTPQQNNLTDVFSTVLKHLVNYLHSAHSSQVSGSCVHTGKPYLQALAKQLGWVSVRKRPLQGSSWARYPDRGSFVRARSRDRGYPGASRWVGSSFPAGSLGWWQVLGGLWRAWREGEGETQPWAAAVSLFSLAGHPASCRGLSPALNPSSSARPVRLREQRGGGLGEVERFVPGEQAVGERRASGPVEPPRAPAFGTFTLLPIRASLGLDEDGSRGTLIVPCKQNPGKGSSNCAPPEPFQPHCFKPCQVNQGGDTVGGPTLLLGAEGQPGEGIRGRMASPPTLTVPPQSPGPCQL